jgi:hypothetical protein
VKTSPLGEVIKVYKGLLRSAELGKAPHYAVNVVMRRRRQKSYQRDIQEQRQALGIPIQGYGRREASRVLRAMKSRSSVMVAALQFAQNHPLDKNHAMPAFVALEELLLKRPRTSYSLAVALGGVLKDGEAFLENGEKRAPQPLARLVKSKSKGRDDEWTRCITTETFFGEDVAWSLTKQPPT